MKTTRRSWIIAVALVLTVAGCDDNAELDKDGPVKPAACASAPQFGNGQLCDDTPAGRAACGTGVCAGGWLCFDAPRLAFCSCSTDADCERRATYVNQARAQRKMAPITASCEAGRCAGFP